MDRPELVAFDVNETLLSLAPLREGMAQVFGDDPPVGEWFARMLHGSLVANHLNRYRPFGEIGVDALLALAHRRGVMVSKEQAVAVVAIMKSLPPYPEVYGALERLNDAGLVMIALTNGSAQVANAQIENAGLHPFMRRVVSVEEVRRFKPDPMPYRRAAEAMGVDLRDMMLVAAHDWDCAGAISVGARAVFVTRPGAVWSLPSPMPDREVSDIAQLAAELTG
ncbi:MAG: haloacid dehalogenase type II [Acidimicrobiia bacterium]